MEEIKKPSLYADETVFDGVTEQGVELEYVLPDYCPDIFKVLSCTLTPKVVSYSTAGDSRLNIDGIVYIKVLYLGEKTGNVHCIDQRFTYSKTVDMSQNRKAEAMSEPVISLQMKSDYCSCRAVSPRRIDVRGAVSCRIKAVCSVEYPLTVIPSGLQVRSSEMTCCGRTLHAGKQTVVREEIDTGASAIAFILQSSAVPRITDLRVIADKAVLKGTVTINALYGISDPENGGASSTERMTADIPISAIIDISGITSMHRTFPELIVMNCELVPKADGGAPAGGIMSCELLVECRVSAQLEETVSVATDVYSTEYETVSASNTLKAAANPRVIPQSFTLRTEMNAESDIRSVWDAYSELRNVRCRADKDCLSLTGQLCVGAYGVNNDGTPFYCEKQEPVEETITADGVSPEASVEVSANITDTGFSIDPDGMLEITSAAELRACVRDVISVEAISEVTVCEDKPKARSDEFALRICYTDDKSDCWSIAKRCNTTVEAIMEENGLTAADEPLGGMIVIPVSN